MTIDILPDDVLIGILNLYIDQAQSRDDTERSSTGSVRAEDAWQVLVHVCRRWRCIVFELSTSLNLLLLYTPRRHVRTMLDVWPPLPISIYSREQLQHPTKRNNVIEALKQHSRIYKIDIENPPNALMEAMKEPFPELTSLKLTWFGTTGAPGPPVLPDSFLGGSAPRLRLLSLCEIPFPAMGKLLLSTSGLVMLRLRHISHSGYFSPEGIVACLSSLTRLEILDIRFKPFRPPLSLAIRNPYPSPHSRIVIPALSSFHFTGDSKYLEKIVAQIDAPLLNHFHISFFSESTLDTPLLRHFLSCWEAFQSFDQAEAAIGQHRIGSVLYPRKRMTDPKVPVLIIETSESEGEEGEEEEEYVWSLEEICSLSLPPLVAVECLEIRQTRWYRGEHTGNARWLEILRPFTSVTKLVLYNELAGRVAPALQTLTAERVPKFLPALQDISIVGPQLSRPIQEAIEQFVATRELFGCSITVHHREFGQDSLRYRLPLSACVPMDW